VRGKERIKLHDTFGEAIEKIIEGNIGALSVVMELSAHYLEIDPDAVLGPLSPVLDFDTRGIFGPRIWGFAKDVCEGSLVKVAVVLRAVQLGILPAEDLDRAIDRCRHPEKPERFTLPIEDLTLKVKKELPNFNEKWEARKEEKGAIFPPDMRIKDILDLYFEPRLSG